MTFCIRCGKHTHDVGGSKLHRASNGAVMKKSICGECHHKKCSIVGKGGKGRSHHHKGEGISGYGIERTHRGKGRKKGRRGGNIFDDIMGGVNKVIDTGMKFAPMVHFMG